MLSPEPMLLHVRGLQKRYSRREGWRTRQVVALSDIDLDIRRGSTVAVLGESGAGKTTLARCIATMESFDQGSMVLDDVDIARASQRELQRIRPAIQLIFQDPSTALNPRLTAEELIAEPLVVQDRGTRDERATTVANLMREVGLSPEWRKRRPAEFSGGQLQRIAIARALAIQPKLLILDEAFTGLDLSTAAQIANLLLDLRAAHGLTYILISHDIAFAAQFADDIAVMSAGRIVERGPARSILQSPQAEETKMLVANAQSAGKALSRAAGESA